MIYLFVRPRRTTNHYQLRLRLSVHVLLLLLATCISITNSSDGDVDTTDLLHVVKERATYSNSIFAAPISQRAAGCSLSEKKRKKYCKKKSCKSKSSPKCQKRADKLKECCDKNCDCEDDNSKFVNVTQLIEQCGGLGATPLPDPSLDVAQQRRRLRRFQKIFKAKFPEQSYTFESRRGSDGIWGDWTEYTVIDGQFETNGLSDFDFFGWCDPVCKAWNMEDLFDATSVGIKNYPSDEFQVYLSIVLYEVKYSKKGFPKYLRISPIQAIPEEPSGGGGGGGGIVAPSLKTKDPTEDFTVEELPGGVGPIIEDLVGEPLGPGINDLELDTCRPLEIQVRRVKKV